MKSAAENIARFYVSRVSLYYVAMLYPAGRVFHREYATPGLGVTLRCHTGIFSPDSRL